MMVGKRELAYNVVALLAQRVGKPLRAGDSGDGGDTLVRRRNDAMQREQRQIPRRDAERVRHAYVSGELIGFRGAAVREHRVGNAGGRQRLTQPSRWQ